MGEREESLPREIQKAWMEGQRISSLADVNRWSSVKFGSVNQELEAVLFQRAVFSPGGESSVSAGAPGSSGYVSFRCKCPFPCLMNGSPPALVQKKRKKRTGSGQKEDRGAGVC